jgi:hypothetical protein
MWKTITARIPEEVLLEIVKRLPEEMTEHQFSAKLFKYLANNPEYITAILKKITQKSM